MKRALAALVLVFWGVLTVSPAVFLLTGTFMGNQEMMELTAPMVSGRDGYVSWRLLPQFPTLQNVVGLLLDSPEFFQMFWNSVKLTGAILAGQLIVGMPAAWGLARYSFRGRGFLYMLYIMMMPFQVTMLSEHLVLEAMGLMDTSASVILPGIKGGNAGLSLCASLAALLPAVFVFLMGQDYLEQGIASSAVKE